MPRQNKVKTEMIVLLYTVHHHTMEEIAARCKMSRQAVRKRLLSAGVTADKGERVECICDNCGKAINVTRGRWRKALHHYCSRECFGQSLIIPGSFHDRNGKRIARQVVSQAFDLQPGHIVHHKDGNQANNAPNNLRVFANQAHHLRAHRGFDVPYLWDGANRPG